MMYKIFFFAIIFLINFAWASAQITANQSATSSSNVGADSSSASSVSVSNSASASATACSNNVCVSTSQSQGGSASSVVTGQPSAAQAISEPASVKTASSTTVKKTEAVSVKSQEETVVAVPTTQSKPGEVTIADSQKAKSDGLPSITNPPQTSAAKDVKALPGLTNNNWKAALIIILIALVLGFIAYFGTKFLFNKKSAGQQDLFSYKPDENLDSFRVGEKDSEVQDSLPAENKENRW